MKLNIFIQGDSECDIPDDNIVVNFKQWNINDLDESDKKFIIHELEDCFTAICDQKPKVYFEDYSQQFETYFEDEVKNDL